MAKLNELFDQFLSNIEPDSEAKKYAHDAHQPVRQFLENDNEFGQYFVNSFLYGSYRRHTAIGDIKDVDIVVLTNFDPESNEDTPQKTLRRLKAALARYYNDPENPEYQRRSIRINQPLPNTDSEMTLDIIPAVAVSGEDNPLKVPDREQKEWIWSHPKGHIEHSSELNKDDNSQGKFVPLVKMLKWWWKYQSSVRQPRVERPKPKGFWVECLTGLMFDRNQQDWADHFIGVLQNISTKYSNSQQVPKLPDPGLPGETLKTSMNLEEFRIFMGAVNDSLRLAIQARSEPNELSSSKLWQNIFGNEFPLYDETEVRTTQTQPSEVALATTSHAQFPPWPNNLGVYKVEIKAYICAPNFKVMNGLRNDGRVITSGLLLKFKAETNARGLYEVRWQVVNTGVHASTKNGLRGNFFEAKLPSGSLSDNPLENWEHTEYTGKHWIECFIVKDGQMIARSGKFYVKIKNPHF